MTPVFIGWPQGAREVCPSCGLPIASPQDFEHRRVHGHRSQPPALCWEAPHAPRPPESNDGHEE